MGYKPWKDYSPKEQQKIENVLEKIDKSKSVIELSNNQHDLNELTGTGDDLAFRKTHNLKKARIEDEDAEETYYKRTGKFAQ